MFSEKSYNLAGGEDAKERGEKDIEKNINDLTIIAQRIGGDFGMKVSVGQPGQGSFFNPDEISITLDPDHILENPDQAKFVVAHEGGHRAISKSPKELGLPDKKIEELYGQIGFAFSQNVIEDAADNDWVAAKFPGIEKYVKKNYDRTFEKENAILSTPEVSRLAKRLGYWPKFVQYGSEVLRQWHTKNFSTKLDEKVKKALKETDKDVKKSVSLIPSTQKYEEKDIIKKAQERFTINTNNIWPHIKELIDSDFDNEEQRQAAQDIYNKMKEMEKMENEKRDAQSMGDKEKEEKAQKQIDDMKKDLESKGFSKELLDELEKKIEEALKKMEEQESEGEDGDKNEKKGGKMEKNSKKKGIENGEGQPIPVDQFSEELKKKLKEYFDKLPKDKQKEIQDKAKDILKKFEDAINKEFEGKLNKNKPENHDKQKGKNAKNQQAMKDAMQRSEEINTEKQQQKERLDKLREEMMSGYEKKRADLVGMIDYLYLRLRHILKPEEYGGQETGYPSGQILDMSRAMQGDRDVVQKQKMWIRENSPERKDYRFWHLIDLSGSMDGTNIEEAFKGFVVASEAVDRVEDFNSESINIHQGITGFHNRIFEYKDYKERYTRSLEDKLFEMMKRPNDNDAGTNTYKGTMTALENLKSDLGTTGNFLLTFTDGDPNYDVRDGLKDLIKTTKGEREKKKIKLGLIWLGDSDEKIKELVKEYGYDFGLSLPISRNKKGKNFSEALADLLEDIVRNPDKY